VVAPILVVLYDLVFFSAENGATVPLWRRRWPLYAGLACSWVLMVALVVAFPRGASVGFFLKGWTPWLYLQTQAGVIVYYLRLVAVPWPLSLDYEWPAAQSFLAVAPQAVFLAAVLALVVAGAYGAIMRVGITSSMRRALYVAGPAVAALAIGAAAWVSLGVLAVDAPDAQARVGLLPPVWVLAASVALALAAVWRAPASRLLPACLLALPVLPWLPVPVPAAALLWTGPAVWWVWAGAGAIALASAGVRLPDRLIRVLTARRTGGLAAGLLATLLVGGAWVSSPRAPTGDEPHYLLIAQSLLNDGDLLVRNNYARGDYREYYGGELEPHLAVPGRNGQQRSIHAPGVAAIVAPAYAIGGHRAVVLWLALLTGLGTFFVWRAGLALTGSAAAAWFGWAAVIVSAPVLFHGFAVYPDPISSLVVAASVYALIRAQRPADAGLEPDGLGVSPPWTPAAWVALGAAVGVLPWLHTRLAIPAAAIAGCVALRLARWPARLSRLAAFCAPLVVSVALWLASFVAIYGTLNPSAPYGSRPPLNLAGAAGGFLALWMDQEYGILVNAPVYLAAIAGLVLLWQHERRLAAEFTAIVVPYLLVVGAFDMWYGGQSAPARFAVPTLAALGVAAAHAWARSSPAWRAVFATLLTVSLLISISLALGGGGGLLYNNADGRALWAAWLSPLADLPAALPSAFRAGSFTLAWQTLLWAAVAALGGMLYALLASRGRKATGTLAVLASTCGAATLMVGLGLSWWMGGVPAVAVAPAQLAMLQRYDPDLRPLGVRLDGLALFDAASLVRSLSIPPAPHAGLSAGVVHGVPGLPPGTYEIDAQAPIDQPMQLSVEFGRSPGPLFSWSVLPGERVRRSMSFPIPAGPLVVRASGGVGPAAPVTLRPMALFPRPWATDEPVRAAGRFGTTTVFTVDDRARLDADGIAVVGERQPLVILVPDAAQRPIRLLVRNGPVAARITLASRRWRVQLDLAPGEEARPEIPGAGGPGGADLRIGVARGAAPPASGPSAQTRQLPSCTVSFPGPGGSQ
jgi:hypothetical protein